MRKMNKKEKKIIENEIRMIMQKSVSSDYTKITGQKLQLCKKLLKM